MARMKFVCDAERCIECNGCVTACKNENEVPWGVNRRRVVTLNDGVPGEKSISVACMHCSDAPCMAVCPVNCFYRTDEGVVLHDKTFALAAAIAPTLAHSAHPSSHHRAHLAYAAKWTNARFARAALKPTVAKLSLKSMAATAWLKANYPPVRSNAQPKRFWLVMAT